MTQHDQISAFIDNELTHDAEQDFLISLASNDGVRKAFRSELVLKSVIHQDELLTSPNRDIRGAILATVGIGTVTVLTSQAHAATTATSTGMKAFFATKVNALLTAAIITASAATGYVTSSVINNTPVAETQVTKNIVVPQTSVPSLTMPTTVTMPAQTEIVKETPKTMGKKMVSQSKAPLTKTDVKPTEPTPINGGTAGAGVDVGGIKRQK